MSNQKSTFKNLIEIFRVIGAVVILTLAIVAIAERGHDNAVELLQREGYTNIDAGYIGFIGCTKDEHMNIPFTAINKNGAVVEGNVCGGVFFTGSIIRFR